MPTAKNKTEDSGRWCAKAKVVSQYLPADTTVTSWPDGLQSHPENTVRRAWSHLTGPNRKLLSKPVLPGDRESEGPSCAWSNFSFSATALKVLASLAKSHKKWRGWKGTEARAERMRKDSRFWMLGEALLSPPTSLLDGWRAFLSNEFIVRMLLGLLLFFFLCA